MKVIDLLNKIANGEEVPIKVKYGKKIYEYQEGSYDYLYYVENNGTMLFLFTELFNTCDNILDILNIELKEVEIIEEDKKIEKIDMFDYFTGYDFDGTSKELLKLLERNFEKTNEKLNEIIDYLNKENK